MKETGDVEEGNTRVPVGVHLAVLFMWVMIVALVIVVLGLTILAVPILFSSALSDDLFPGGVALSLIVASAVMISVGMLSGALWLVTLLEGRETGRYPGHPGRKIGLAMVGTLVVAGLIALIAWLTSIFTNSIADTFPWLLAWGCVGGGSFRLYLYLDLKLPR